jgi:hypothetical protein
MPAKKPEHRSFKKGEEIALKTVRKVFPLGESKAGVNTTDSHRRSRAESKWGNNNANLRLPSPQVAFDGSRNW